MSRQQIDRYQVKYEIGRGGMATVYYAYDPRVKRDVAIKLLLAQLTADPTLRERFEREAAIIASLDHPAIVPVYDYGEDEGQPYIVMRFMAGGSLEGRLHEHGSLRVGEAAQIVERIAAALDQAHGQGLVHRDLKPGNILFDQYGQAHLSDFGIAHIVETGSMAKKRRKSRGGAPMASLTGGGLLGTPNYISPEQVVGAKVDARSDVYSLAVLLYTMLAGKPPYAADTPTAVALKHISEPPPDIRKARPRLPPEIQPILERGMAKDREDRYASAGDLAEDVLRLAERHVAAPARRTPTSTGLKQKKVKAKPEAEKTRGGKHVELTQAAVPPPAAPGARPRPPNKPMPLRKSRRPREARKKRSWRWPLVGVALLAVMVAAVLLRAGLLPIPSPQDNPQDQAALAGDQTAAPTPTSAAGGGATPAEISALVLPTGEPPTTTLAPNLPTPIGGGSRIAYVSGVEISALMDLFVMNADGSNAIQLTFDAADNRSPVFSPDGTQIAYRAEREGRRVIFVVAADGSSAPVALTDPSSDNYAPAWSPDGTKIAFVSERDGDPEIYVMNADGSSPVRLTDSWANDYSPVWSPEGARLAYFSNLEGGQDIYVMNADASNAVRLTTNAVHDYMPAWAPDGARLAFVTERDTNPEIYVMNADGSEQTRLTYQSAADLYPSFSPDGQWLVFTSRRDGNTELYRMRADGSEVTRLTFNDDGDLDPRWGP